MHVEIKFSNAVVLFTLKCSATKHSHANVFVQLLRYFFMTVFRVPCLCLIYVLF